MGAWLQQMMKRCAAFDWMRDLCWQVVLAVRGRSLERVPFFWGEGGGGTAASCMLLAFKIGRRTFFYHPCSSSAFMLSWRLTLAPASWTWRWAAARACCRSTPTDPALHQSHSGHLAADSDRRALQQLSCRAFPSKCFTQPCAAPGADRGKQGYFHPSCRSGWLPALIALLSSAPAQKPTSQTPQLSIYDPDLQLQAVALLDVDFSPSSSLSARMSSQSYREALMNVLRRRAAVVLPAFEAANSSDPGALALLQKTATAGKPFVLTALAEGTLLPFQESFHTATNYAKWKRSRHGSRLPKARWWVLQAACMPISVSPC